MQLYVFYFTSTNVEQNDNNINTRLPIHSEIKKIFTQFYNKDQALDNQDKIKLLPNKDSEDFINKVLNPENGDKNSNIISRFWIDIYFCTFFNGIIKSMQSKPFIVLNIVLFTQKNLLFMVCKDELLALNYLTFQIENRYDLQLSSDGQQVLAGGLGIDGRYVVLTIGKKIWVFDHNLTLIRLYNHSRYILSAPIVRRLAKIETNTIVTILRKNDKFEKKTEKIDMQFISLEIYFIDESLGLMKLIMDTYGKKDPIYQEYLPNTIGNDIVAYFNNITIHKDYVIYGNNVGVITILHHKNLSLFDTISLNFSSNAHIWFAPIFHEDNMFAFSDKEVICYNLNQKAVLWRKTILNIKDMLIKDQYIILINQEKQIVFLYQQTGQLKHVVSFTKSLQNMFIINNNLLCNDIEGTIYYVSLILFEYLPIYKAQYLYHSPIIIPFNSSNTQHLMFSLSNRGEVLCYKLFTLSRDQAIQARFLQENKNTKTWLINKLYQVLSGLNIMNKTMTLS